MNLAPKKDDANGISHCPREPISIPDMLQNFEKDIERPIKEICTRVRKNYRKVVGYPCHCAPREEILDDVMGVSLNNEGDPYLRDDTGLDTKGFKLGVLEWFATLWEINLDESWGYITNGGTEANLQALHLAREKLPNGILYMSSESHYSVKKAAYILGLPVERIPCLEHGEIDYKDLKERLEKNAGVPAIINANIGVTMTGAIDDVDKIVQILVDTGHTEDDFYIYCDAALMGIMLPFLQTPCSLTFKKPIDSICVSGHEFLGLPTPSAVYMTRRKHKDLESMQHYVQYVDRIDNTISGSRSGHSAMWYALAKRGIHGVKEETLECVRKAQILHNMLQKVGIDSKLLDYSITVYFPASRELERLDWILANRRNISHVLTMQDVTIQDLEQLASDLARCM